MKDLYELLQLCGNQTDIIRHILPRQKSSPLSKLFEILNTTQGLSDQDCMMRIYNRRNASAFSRVKSRMKDILYYAVSFRDENEFVNAENKGIRFVPYHEYYTAKTLMTLKSFRLAIPLIESSINKYIKHQRTQYVLWLTEFAVAIYGTEINNKYKYAKYLDLQKEYLNKYLLELRTTNFYIDIQRLQLRSVATPDDAQLRRINKFLQECDRNGGVNTVDYKFNYYRIKAFYYEYKKDYSGLYEISHDTLEFFKRLEIKRPATQSNISVRLYWVMTQLGMLDKAIELGLNEMKLFKEGIGPWYRVGHYVIKAMIYKGDYSRAIELAARMISHPRFIHAPDYYVEIYNTLLGYLHLIGSFSDVFEIKAADSLPEFKLGKFLNTTPVFSKDKRGINISIILLHIAWLLKRKDYSAIIDRTDSLNQYAYRYLRRDDTFRSNCMIKMVIQMTKADFHPIRTERYTADLRKQLSSVPLMGSGENIEIEMIPFEVLWDIMMKSLEPA